MLAIGSVVGHTFSAYILESVLGDTQALNPLLSHFAILNDSDFVNRWTVAQALSQACDVGLIQNVRDDAFRFTHDTSTIRTNVTTKGDDGKLLKYTLGSSCNGLLFTAVGLINNAPPKDSPFVASICLQLSQVAAKLAAFKTAAWLADAGSNHLFS